LRGVRNPSAGYYLRVPVDELVDCDTVALRNGRTSCTGADIGHVGVLVAVEACAVSYLVCPDVAAVDHATKSRLRYKGSIDTIEGREANRAVSIVLCIILATTAKN
jgi:hypothetical protein